MVLLFRPLTVLAVVLSFLAVAVLLVLEVNLEEVLYCTWYPVTPLTFFHLTVKAAAPALTEDTVGFLGAAAKAVVGTAKQLSSISNARHTDKVFFIISLLLKSLKVCKFTTLL